jgi:hypothetical protein
MDSLLKDASDVEPLAVLSRFLVDFHPGLTTRADELSELADAVLCADGPVRIDWLLVHQTASYSKGVPGRRPARLRAARHWMLRRARPAGRWSALRGPPRSR